MSCSSHHRRTGDRHQDQGLNLVELLVVLVVVGMLAAVAVPMLLHQRAQAHDASTKSDVMRLGKELATFYVEPNPGTPALDFSDPEYVVVTGGASPVRIALSNGTARPSFGDQASLEDPEHWCVSLIDSQGKIKQFRYSAMNGLEVGACIP